MLKSLLHRYARNFETAEQIARAVMQIALYDLPDDYFANYVPRVEAVTPDDAIAYIEAVSEGYKPGDLEAIGITASPCGGCRQWLWEFRLDTVTFRDGSGAVVTRTPAELLPDAWGLPA